ncbi:coatomer beta subunit appendage platform-domain-containing protein [Dunaliella salina]|uniref:Coatomer subunit beta n=1 Tax=Dunaliella salina TaxID=3046 RepID=A0ABQ7H5C2_DUNSA|nr:coatomer beta subunit appendage platform-domain-containing protein [Dunaliella salina]|eukprot:KAF5842052.1 coatomer beta subunit appendage platform-domain-containing protein [Dunaliella salina]
MALSSVERSCTILVAAERLASPTEIKEALEGNDAEAKVEGMKKAIMLLLSGEQMPQLFITIVRYVLPSEDHTVQKLLLLYLEAIEKTDSSGRLLPEMILICQNLRNNLQHPNEYIRGVTLRFLCRIREEEILEPLVPSILSNLEHRHSYVRRSAVLAINAIYKFPKGELLLQVCRANPGEKGRFIKIILSLLQSNSTAVVYECAVTLVSLSQAPSAIRAAANCYCQLLVSQSDNNVKLIVLDRLHELKNKHREVMQDMLMDTLRALSSPNMDIRKKTLDISMDLITSRNIDEVVMVLKKEVVKTQNKDFERGGEYRQMLVQAIHNCALKFPDVASSVVHLLMDFLGDANTASALDVIFFVREIILQNVLHCATVVRRVLRHPNQGALSMMLLSCYACCGCWHSGPPGRALPSVAVGRVQLHCGRYGLVHFLRCIVDDILCCISLVSSRVCSTALWLLGEYSCTVEDVEAAVEVIKQALGPAPFMSADGAGAEVANAQAAVQLVTVVRRPAVLADGTYATQTAVEAAPAATGMAPCAHNLRALLLGGDFFVGGVVAGTLTKLMLRLRALNATSVSSMNKATASAMLTITHILRLGEAPQLPVPLDDDSRDRMLLCLHVLAHPEEEAVKVWLESCKDSFSALTSEKQVHEAAEQKREDAKMACQPDDLIDFVQLKSKKGLSQIEIEDEVNTDLQRATGHVESAEADAKRLNRVLQLTGLSDPVYAEAYVTVHQYDIVMDVTVINRTQETLQNLCLELATMGDLKLVERPQNYTLAAGQTKVVRANIKVSSTETGVIFGNIVYEGTGYAERSVVVLNDIHIDIMDYISPAVCADVQFRNMWAEFEWENKVAVNTTFTDCNSFLNHIVATTNMQCLTPPTALDGDCGYLAANLYAKSVFGEDALVNVSVEKQSDGRLAGYIRIRSKTQGIALSLGDKITLKQKA